jgi:type II restriction/modification system DNA methylase subunit YeeA
VIETLFRAMNIDLPLRAAARLPGWADAFPYVNGGLFSGSTEVPRFTRIARSYLLRAGELNWREINPDIFGSMIQAVAEDDERGALGMHYTSVPNILKVLNPLFLDDLRAQLEAAGDNPRMLLNLRKRMARIRVFDPACGSGNFLVIAYKEMRAIEAEINRRRGEDFTPRKFPSRIFAASNCATSRQRLPGSPSSLPSSSAMCAIAARWLPGRLSAVEERELDHLRQRARSLTG